MRDSSEVKWLDAGSLPIDPNSMPGRASFELEEAPEILVSDLSDLKKFQRIFQSASSSSTGTTRE